MPRDFWSHWHDKAYHARIAEADKGIESKTPMPDQLPERRYSLMIARFPGGNSEHPSSTNWVLETNLKAARDPRISQVVNWYRSDTPITMTRNLCVKHAQEQGIDYLLMIDSDMHPDLPIPGSRPFWESSWEFMVRRREDERVERAEANQGDPEGPLTGEVAAVYAPATVAAPYCGPPPHENVFVFQYQTLETDDPSAHFKLGQFTREDAACRGGMQRVAALPTGLILYDMRLFNSLPHPWYCYEWTDSYELDKATTEDVYQTRNADLMGFPQFVNWDSWAGHIKSKVVMKPRILPADYVHRALRESIQRGHESNKKLVIIQPRPGDARREAQDSARDIREDWRSKPDVRTDVRDYRGPGYATGAIKTKTMSEIYSDATADFYAKAAEFKKEQEAGDKQLHRIEGAYDRGEI